MIAPRYQDLGPDRVISMDVQDSEVKLIAGEIRGVRGPVDGIVTDPHMLDVALPRAGQFEHQVPRTHNAFAYVIDGIARFERDGADVPRGRLVVLAPDADVIRVTSRDGGRFLLLAGRPIGESVARRGPFVMNTEEELDRAVSDYQAGTLTTL